MGRSFVLLNERAPGVVFFRFQWLWDAGFLLFVRLGPTRRLTQRLVRALGSRGVLRLVSRLQPDMIVSVYPMTTEVLGGLRREGRLDIPVVAGITDLAAMHYWAAPGVDLHLLTHPESEDEVRASPATPPPCRRCTGSPGRSSPPARPRRGACVARTARRGQGRARVGRRLGRRRPRGRDRGRARARRGEVVACLCGRNDELHTRLAERFTDAAFASSVSPN